MLLYRQKTFLIWRGKAAWLQSLVTLLLSSAAAPRGQHSHSLYVDFTVLPQSPHTRLPALPH